MQDRIPSPWITESEGLMKLENIVSLRTLGRLLVHERALNAGEGLRNLQHG
ncbi:MAG: hypothetical protein WBO24_04950 [Nitrospirales bacterium]